MLESFQQGPLANPFTTAAAGHYSNILVFFIVTVAVGAGIFHRAFGPEDPDDTRLLEPAVGLEPVEKGCIYLQTVGRNGPLGRKELTMAVQKLLQLLDIEPVENDIFRGQSANIGGKSVFGGQILGQALMAASRTVDYRRAHSFHSYFLRPGNMTAPIEYRVERLRDGRSFATRRVMAIQQGRSVFDMVASFQVDEVGFEHQLEMPRTPRPEQLLPMADLRKRLLETKPGSMRVWPTEIPLDIRPIIPANPFLLDEHPPMQTFWCRIPEEVGANPALHRCILAYAIDFMLLPTASLPHGIWSRQRNAMMASLDHAMWFHRDFRIDRWLLFSMESPSASNSRGFSLGNIFNEDGMLVATAAQEGLMRRLEE